MVWVVLVTCLANPCFLHGSVTIPIHADSKNDCIQKTVETIGHEVAAQLHISCKLKK